MMYLVQKSFKDKRTKKLHEKETIYESDNEKRIEELRQSGFLGVELIVKKEGETIEEEKTTEEEKKKGKKKGDK